MIYGELTLTWFNLSECVLIWYVLIYSIWILQWDLTWIYHYIFLFDLLPDNCAVESIKMPWSESGFLSVASCSFDFDLIRNRNQAKTRSHSESLLATLKVEYSLVIPSGKETNSCFRTRNPRGVRKKWWFFWVSMDCFQGTCTGHPYISRENRWFWFQFSIFPSFRRPKSTCNSLKECLRGRTYLQ